MTEQEFYEAAKSAFKKYSGQKPEAMFERAIKLAYKLLSEAKGVLGDNTPKSEDILFRLFLSYTTVYTILTGRNLSYAEFKASVEKAVTFDETILAADH